MLRTSRDFVCGSCRLGEDNLDLGAGPQMVGFSMMHIHPIFSILGFLCCFAMMLWLFPYAVYDDDNP